MFQNISKNTEEVFDDEVDFATQSKNEKIIGILKQNFSVPNIIIYALAFMMSLLGGQNSPVFTSAAPFGYAITAASFGAGVPALIVCLVTLVGTAIKFGGSGLLFYILTLLIFVALVLIKRPIEQEESNEKLKVGMQMTVAVFTVQMIKLLFKGFLVYDLLYTLMITITTAILYKVFVNSLIVFKEIKIKKVSEDGNDLVGVVIGIYDSNKNLIEKIKTDEKNDNESKILPLGKYYVKEISTLTGYKLDSNFYEVNLNYNNQNEEVVLGNIKLVNEKIRCDLVYITSDRDGNFLENVEINVVDKDGNLVFNGKTDTQGMVTINNLPYGEYYIRQIKVPSGFILNNDEYKFYVNDSTCNSNINVTNEKTVMPVTSKQNSMYLVSFIILFGIGVYNYVKKDS